MQNYKCKCGKVKAEKLGRVINRGGEDPLIQRVKCTYCGQCRFKSVKPKKDN